MTSRTSGRNPGDTPAVSPGPRPSHRPGQWPDIPGPEHFRAQLLRERARRELTLDSIRAHLEEQPSAHSVRAAARRWVADILATAEDVAQSKMERNA